MERLTYKNYIEEYEVNFEKSFDKNWSIAESDTHIKVTGDPIDKLGELEDVLEKYKIENLEEYIKLHQIDNYAQDFINDLLEENKRVNAVLNLIKQENNDLKNELAELKQKAIVPKYKIKQHIWLARNNVFQKEPCELIVQNIEYHFKTGDFLYIVDFVEKGHYKSIHMCDNGDLFATLEEAEQKLAQLKGKE